MNKIIWIAEDFLVFGKIREFIKLKITLYSNKWRLKISRISYLKYKFADAQVCIVKGPNIDVAFKQIKRLKGIFG